MIHSQSSQSRRIVVWQFGRGHALHTMQRFRESPSSRLCARLTDYGLFILVLLITGVAQCQGQQINSTLGEEVPVTNHDHTNIVQSPAPESSVSPKSRDQNLSPPTSKKSHEHEEDKSKKINVILYGLLMGFAILLLTTALICFIACFCIPAGCCCVSKSRLHRAGRVYEKAAPHQSSEQPKVFTVEVPASVSAPTLRISSKTVFVETSGGKDPKFDSEHLCSQGPRLEQDSHLPESETKQSPYNPFYFDHYDDRS